MEEPLSNNPVFKKLAIDVASFVPSPHGRISFNLIAYDGFGRLFLWNSAQKLLHFVEIRHPDSHHSSPATLLAPRHYKTLQLDLKVDFEVRCMIINRRGQSMILAGENAIVIVDLSSNLSASFDGSNCNIKCRGTAIGRERLYSSSNTKALRVLQVSWHPYSDTHIGILSSDGVFRLFDLSLDAEIPEQEYHLQAGILERSNSVTYARPVAFAFGGEHLWDRFAVFILFSNGFIYALCPVVPFGSVFNTSAIEELYKDARQWASPSSSVNSKVVGNATLGAAWLEAVFPSLFTYLGSLNGHQENSLVLKAHAHVPFDASLLLQGPLPIIMSGETSSTDSGFTDHTGRALMLLYNTVGKDSILAVSLRDGQMHIYALADELQPVWNEGITPCVRLNEEGNLLSVGILAEASKHPGAPNQVSVKSSLRGDVSMVDRTDCVWSGQPPPLLQLAVIDFALQAPVLEAAPLCLLGDPVVPERLYCYHAAGLDAILLQWLPFSEQSVDRTSPGKSPVVYPILDTCPGGSSAPSPLLGVADILDSFGEMWLVAVTASCECAVIEMKAHRTLAPLHFGGLKKIEQEPEIVEAGVLQVMSKDLLLGPKDIPIPQVPSSGRPLTLDSIEGRAFLHDQCKLLHEKYIEYAHRVHVELTSHGARLHIVMREQHAQLNQAQNKLLEALTHSDRLTVRIKQAFERNKNLEKRIKSHSTLLSVRQKPLTAAEREFKAQLDIMRLQDMEILHSAVDVLKERLQRYLRFSQLQKQDPSRKQTSLQGKVIVPEVQMNGLKVAMDQLTQVVEVTAKQAKSIDELVKKREVLFHS